MEPDINARFGTSKHAGLTFKRRGEGKVARKPCERLSGHGSSPLGEESETEPLLPRWGKSGVLSSHFA